MERKIYVFAVMFFVFFILVSGLSFAGPERGGRIYEVTITNLTRGQIFSAPVVISHNGNFRLFTLGDPASDQLYPLAEDADTVPLTSYMDTLHSVFDYIKAEDGIPPGGSATLEINTRGFFRFISVVGMLVTTNDAFFAVQGVRVPTLKETVIVAEAYDAGSEANSELCANIPGPPCGNGGVRETNGAEGYVHVHAGIHGIADLVPARDDWRNPVAKITIRPIYR